MLLWFTYHNVLRIIAIIIIVAIVGAVIAAVADETKPVTWLGRFLRKLFDYLGTITFLVNVAALVTVILFWLIYPMTPDYRDHEREQSGTCQEAGFVNEGHTTWVHPDVCHD